MPHLVAIVVGSLRKDSFNRKIANTFIKVAPPTLKPEIVEIAGLTFFNQDIEGNPPASWVAFKSKIKAADASAVCHAGVQPLDAGRAQERHRRRVAPVRRERLGRQTSGDHQRLDRRRRRLRR
jgi:hypothetical protein